MSVVPFGRRFDRLPYLSKQIARFLLDQTVADDLQDEQQHLDVRPLLFDHARERIVEPLGVPRSSRPVLALHLLGGPLNRAGHDGVRTLRRHVYGVQT
jgi:hypothetical protein